LIYQINPVVEFHKNLSNNNENAIFIDCSYQTYINLSWRYIGWYAHISTISIYH